MNLRKELNFLGIFSLATGAMISSGLFVLPGFAYNIGGASIFLAYLIGGIIAILGLFSEVEIATAMPKAGGSYFYITRIMGPAVGSINEIVTWFTLTLKTSFAIVGMSAFLQYIGNIDFRIAGVVTSIIFCIVNLFGIKDSVRIQIYLATFLIAILSFFIFKGLSYIKLENFDPFFKDMSIFSTVGFVFVSYGGLLNITSVSEEVKDPGKNIPRGMFVSAILTTILYTFVVLITVGVLGPRLVSGENGITLTPISDAAHTFLGTPGEVLLGIAAILAFVSTANAGIMAASRYPFSLSRDGLLPKLFSNVNKKNIPYVSVLTTTLIVILTIFIELDFLVKAASTVVVSGYIMSSLGVIVLRESKILNYHPLFRSPFYPYIQITTIIIAVFLIVEIGITAFLTTLGLILLSGLFYIFYGSKKRIEEYALLYLIERITNKQLVTRRLENELKMIIRERDNITKDRFDMIVEKACVLDTDATTADNLFKEIAVLLSDKIDLDKEKIYKLLKEREEESSTAITNFLAIPHIIIEGSNKFYIVLARSKNGVFFSDNYPSIKAIFVLIGTKDERNFHLKALSFIAQIVKNKDFEKKWISATSEEGLKDVVILSERVRD
ncbi:MAG TPA: amino acid permease [Spirochaetota bacterium]|nr:amino acid permease [Spirochaetota bacterium]HOM37698.1 amino acid permease [Spirochaetota bacterium]HPQ49656.1 amino acid permease [Spirochaetota bacterium]